VTIGLPIQSHHEMRVDPFDKRTGVSWPWLMIPLGALLLVLIYSLPVELQFFSGRAYSYLRRTTADGWQLPYLRTFAFAAISILIELLLGFYGAVSLLNSSPIMRRFLPALMLPALSGSVSIAFLWKLNIMRFAFLLNLIVDRAFVETWGLILGIQIWQYAPLFMYLFWVRLRGVERNETEFATLHRLTLTERIRDIYWPNSHNLAAFLALFGFIVGVQEYSKFQLILRASAGTSTELATQRIARYYDYYSMIDPSRATQITLAYGALFLLFAASSGAVIIPVVTWCLGASARAVGAVRLSAELLPTAMSDLFAGVIISALFVPILVLIPPLRPTFSFLQPGVITSVSLTVTALLLVIGISLSSGIVLRLAFRNTLDRFTRRSLLVFVGILSLNFVPSIAIAFCGYYWLATFRRWVGSGPLVVTLWIVGETILALPIITSFVLYTHFDVPNGELDFQRTSAASLREIAMSSFLTRFTLPYALTCLFGFTLIWNEYTFTSVVSGVLPNLPSLALELTQKVDGLGASYSDAVVLILLSSSPVAFGLVMWQAFTRSRGSGRAGGLFYGAD